MRSETIVREWIDKGYESENGQLPVSTSQINSALKGLHAKAIMGQPSSYHDWENGRFQFNYNGARVIIDQLCVKSEFGNEVYGLKAKSPTTKGLEELAEDFGLPFE